MNEQHHVSGKGILVKDAAILLIQYFEEGVGVHYNIPGGKQFPNERISDTVKRKMYEEAGAEVDVGKFLFMYEYIGINHNLSLGDKHSVSLIFECKLRPRSVPSMERCTKPDELRQTDVCWVPLNRLKNVLLYPRMTDQILEFVDIGPGERDRYVGDID